MLNDLRTAIRQLRRQPGVTAAAVATLALGIGANVAMFGIVRSVLLGPIPVADADRIVVVTERRSTSRAADLPVSGHEFVAWGERSHAFDRMALYRATRAHLTGAGGEPEAIEVVHASADYFPLLGRSAVVGRLYETGSGMDATASVTMLSNGLWRRRFAADPGVVGTTISLDGEPFTVIGVLPPLPSSLEPDVWIPLDVATEARAVGRHNLFVLARLMPGVSLEQARADLRSVASQLEAELPGANTGHATHVTPLRESLTGTFRRPLLLLTLAVAFVLLIACANVANLLLARAAGREREFAVRAALGASRGRVIRQLLIESTALAALGGAAGVLLAVWSVELASRITVVRVPLLETARLDWQALGFALAATVFAGLAAGLAPSLRWSRAPALTPRESLRTPTAAGHRLRATLVAAQVALTLVLLFGTGLLAHSLLRLTRVDAGFLTEDRLVVPLDLPGTRYGSPHDVRAFVQRVLADVRALPGAQSAGAVSHLPLGGADNWMHFAIDGRPPAQPGQEPYAPFRVAAQGYFETIGIPLVRGRSFDARDARRALPLIRWYAEQPYPPEFERPQPAPVAVVSEAAAREFWPGEDPIGESIRVLFSPSVTVVGVVGDVLHNALNLPAYPHIYLSHDQEPWGSLSLVVAAEDGSDIAAAVHAVIRTHDPSLPITVTPMEEVRAASIGRPRLIALVVAIFGAVALGLALVGVGAVVGTVAAERTREIGVRVALGADRREILALVVRQGMRPVAAGILVGGAAALALGRSLASLLFGVDPGDPITFGVVVILLVGAAALACLIPASRAARLDPLAVLRSE